MPISTDEVGQVLERRMLDTLFFMLREAYRARLAQEARESGLVEQAAGAAAENGPYAIANCKSPKNAKLAAVEIRAAAHEAGVQGFDKMPIFTAGRQVAFPDSIKEIALQRLADVKIPCVIVADDIKPDTTRDDVADPTWDRVDLIDPVTGEPLAERDIAQIEGYLDEAGIEFSRSGNAVVYRAQDRESLISSIEEHGREVPFEDLDKNPAATERQLKYISDLYDQGRISPDQMASFSLCQTKSAASELITSALGSGRLGPDLVRDAQAAMRREDIGNVETTADYVQSRPNAGDHDRSTPYADQCDPSGAGDVNGDGIRDAAQDRDGDGTPDPDDPDNIGEDTRDPQVLCEEKTQESAYIDSLPKSRAASISFQQESR